MNSAEIELALQKLTVLGSALYIAAHPDDENTALLAYLSKEMKLRTGYLSLTRGDGGQNLIGTESGDLLGILRTQELLAARRIDGAEQFFTRARDFGYSKSPEETLEIWDREKILSDMVRIIRQFRPDVIITRFAPEMGGHGHHRASAILAIEAFHAAADPQNFPEQLTDLEPWQARRIVWNAWRPALEDREIDLSKLPWVDLGAFNPLLGRSYLEISAKSRSMHKSQGFGASPRRGSYPEYFIHLAGDTAYKDLMQGVELDWNRETGGDAILEMIRRIQSEWNAEKPAASIPELITLYQRLNQPPDSHWKTVKAAEVKEIVRSCLGLWLEAQSDEYFVSAGSTLQLKLKVLHRSDMLVQLKKLEFPFSKKDSTLSFTLKNNIPADFSVRAQLPDNAISQPYWLVEPSTPGTFTVSDEKNIGKPEAPPELQVTFHLEIEGEPLHFQMPVLHFWTDPVQGERQRRVLISPEVSVSTMEEIAFFTSDSSRQLDVILRNLQESNDGAISLQSSDGWKVTPSKRAYQLSEFDEVMRSHFTLTPPANATGIMAFYSDPENISQKYYSLTTIDYPHIPLQAVFLPAELKLVSLDIQIPRRQIGYIMGSGDDIPGVLSQLGFDITLLTEENYNQHNLENFDVILIGIRAYNTQKWLTTVQPALLNFVKNGGTMVVQYAVTRNMILKDLGPYPFNISHDRVSVESAPVELLDPNHPLLNTPNRITGEDFDGWVQERGLYFADEWDPVFQTPLGSADPGESLKTGGLLYTTYGKGVFIYTGFSFFRQLPAGVTGAIKLFVNLICAENVEHE